VRKGGFGDLSQESTLHCGGNVIGNRGGKKGTAGRVLKAAGRKRRSSPKNSQRSNSLKNTRGGGKIWQRETHRGISEGGKGGKV